MMCITSRVRSHSQKMSFCVFLASLLGLSLALAAPRAPHILVVIVDDFGYSDVSYNGVRVRFDFCFAWAV